MKKVLAGGVIALGFALTACGPTPAPVHRAVESTVVSESPTPEVTTTTPEATPTPVVTPTTAKPKPATHVATRRPVVTTRTSSRPRATATKSSSTSYAGVHPGAFCKPHWAYGYTSAGTRMQCKTSATDSRFRWRRA